MNKHVVSILLLAACSQPNDPPTIPSAQPTEVDLPVGLAPCYSDPHQNLALLMGASTENAAQFNVLVPSTATVTAHAVREGSVREAKQYREFYFAEQPCKVVRVLFDDLAAASDYTLDVEVARGRVAYEEQRHFRTQNPEAEAFRVGFSTCMNDEPAYLPVQRNVYQTLTDQRPDLMIIGGDLVYVDAWAFWPDGYEPGKNVHGGDIWRRYVESWLALDLYHQDPLTPVIATWDDHDFGMNDGDSSFKLASSGTATFTAFYGAEAVTGKRFSYARSNATPVGASYRAGDELFVLLDNRSERTAEPGSQYKHWGLAQEMWLDETIKDAPRTWIISGNQFRGDHHEKNSLSTEDPLTFARLLERIGKRPENSVVLLAGDTHTTEVQQYPTPNGKIVTEFTVSPLHSRISDKHIKLNDPERENPLRLKHPSGVDFGTMQPNFAIFALPSTGTDFTVTFYGETPEPILSPVTFPGPAR